MGIYLLALYTAFGVAIYYSLKSFLRYVRPNQDESTVSINSCIVAFAVWWALAVGLSGGFLISVFCFSLYLICKWLIIGINPHWEEKAKGWIIFGMLIVWLGLVFAVVPRWGKQIPESLFERDEYQRMLYVRMYPEDSGVKSYRVPALINATSRTDYDGEEAYDVRFYEIKFAVMPNGGKIVFEDQDESLELHKKITLVDKSEREWGVELTAEPADN